MTLKPTRRKVLGGQVANQAEAREILDLRG